MPKSYITTTLEDILDCHIIEPASTVSNKINTIIDVLQNRNNELIDQIKNQGLENPDQLFEIVKNYQHQKLLDSINYFSLKDELFIALDIDNYQVDIKNGQLRKRRQT